jgi:hypothetical protein
MKRFALAGLLAVAGLIAVQQQASAGCGFSGSIGLNYSFNCGCYGPCCGPNCGFTAPAPTWLYPPAPYWAGGGYDGASYYPGYASQAPAPQAAPAAPAPARSGATTTPVGYYYYPYTYGYGYDYQAPSYWYGR